MALFIFDITPGTSPKIEVHVHTDDGIAKLGILWILVS